MTKELDDFYFWFYLFIDIIIRLDGIFKIIYKTIQIIILKFFPQCKDRFKPIILTN